MESYAGALMKIIDFSGRLLAICVTNFLPSPCHVFAIIIYFEGTARDGEKLFCCVLPPIFPARRKINTADNEGIVGTTQQQYRRHFNFRWFPSFFSFSFFPFFFKEISEGARK